MNMSKKSTQKKILEILANLPMDPDGGYGQKNNTDLSKELGIDIDEIIRESHKLEKKPHRPSTIIQRSW